MGFEESATRGKDTFADGLLDDATADFEVYFEAPRSAGLLTPLTDAAKAWVDKHVERNMVARTIRGPALAVGHDYITVLLHGMNADGFKVRYKA